MLDNIVLLYLSVGLVSSITGKAQSLLRPAFPQFALILRQVENLMGLYKQV